MAEQNSTLAGLRRSPAAHLHDRMAAVSTEGPRGVALREVPFLPMVGLRAVPGSPGGRAVAEAIGSPLPTTPGPVAEGAHGASILRIGPDEFLLVGPEGLAGADGPAPWTDGADTAARLAEALGEHPGQAVDLSANRTTLELTGPSARAVLEKGCRLDLHPRAFAVGCMAATSLGPVQVLLWRVAEEGWRIMPRASFVDYTTRWLLDAMEEFSSPELP